MNVICMFFVKFLVACVTLLMSNGITLSQSSLWFRIITIALLSALIKCWLMWYLGKKIFNTSAMLFLNHKLVLDWPQWSKRYKASSFTNTCGLITHPKEKLNSFYAYFHILYCSTPYSKTIICECTEELQNTIIIHLCIYCAELVLTQVIYIIPIFESESYGCSIGCNCEEERSCHRKEKHRNKWRTGAIYLLNYTDLCRFNICKKIFTVTWVVEFLSG